MKAPSPEKLELLRYWITEREAMRHHKDNGGTFPHSKDWTMAETRYCNVHREDDKVTRWIKDNWRDRWVAHKNLPAAMCLARMVNYIPTLAEMPWPVDWSEPYEDCIIEVLEDRRAQGLKTWSSAYLITTCGKQMAKEDYVVKHVCREVARLCGAGAFNGITTLQRMHERLMWVDGLGSFLAAQIVADLKNVPGHLLNTAPDFRNWSAPGPGSLKGLTALFEERVTERNYNDAIWAAWNSVAPLLPEDLRGLHMQDFQNTICEFSKFMRVRAGGMSRNNYRG